jgi:hypothetical protein
MPAPLAMICGVIDKEYGVPEKFMIPKRISNTAARMR